MIPSNQTIFYTCFCLLVLIKKVQNDGSQKVSLEDEYYTTIPYVIDQILPQDEKDAQAIIDSNKKMEVIASILPYREKIRRYAISQNILDRIMIGGCRSERREQRRYWIADGYYVPQFNDTFKDLCYGLVKDENRVLSGYLANFFSSKDETSIIIPMVLTKNMQDMIAAYDNTNYPSFKTARKNQRSPFENMLRVWVRQNRETIEKEELIPDTITLNANALKEEQDDGGWHENRDKLESVLMRKSIKFARAVIQEFEKVNGGKAIENIISDNVQSHGLNHDLADAYSSLAHYIKNKYKYTADILYKYSDGADQWAVWIMSIAVLQPEEWPEVDKVFIKDHKGTSLSKFILEKLANDKVMAEMIALIVDRKFKPSTFSEKPAINEDLKKSDR